MTLQPQTVVLTALKRTEDGNGLILRLSAWAGGRGDVEVHLPQGATAATVANLMERPAGIASNSYGNGSGHGADSPLRDPDPARGLPTLHTIRRCKCGQLNHFAASDAEGSSTASTRSPEIFLSVCTVPLGQRISIDCAAPSLPSPKCARFRSVTDSWRPWTR